MLYMFYLHVFSSSLHTPRKVRRWISESPTHLPATRLARWPRSPIGLYYGSVVRSTGKGMAIITRMRNSAYVNKLHGSTHGVRSVKYSL